MSGTEIMIALPLIATGIEIILGAIPNKYVPYRSRILKLLSMIKGIGPFFQEIDKK